MSRYLEERRAVMMGLQPKAGKKEPVPIAKISEKKKQEMKDAKPQQELQEEWFARKISEQTGVCMECGGSTKSAIYVYAKATVAHILPKRKGMFPSVATHEHNALELCATNGCHARYDISWEDAAQMKCWPIAVEKFKSIYPSIAAAEKRHLPDVLLQEVEPI